VRVAVVGGTGPFGRGLARRLAAAGEEVVIGSRDPERAAAVASELGVAGAANADAVRGADLVVLATKAEAAVDTARELAGALSETPLLSVASALSFGKDGVRPQLRGTSLAEQVASVVRAPVAAGLHSIAAGNLAGDEAPDEDTLVCGDDDLAKGLALELAEKVVAGRAFDAGPLAVARALEGLTAAIINLNRRYHARTGLSVTGVE
jgi:8-hydroxy-5-deazaflavin:NADPH oxidoreductase